MAPADERAEAELTSRECWDLLRSQAYGRLALNDESGPMIYPINALVDHGTLVFRTGAGGKVAALEADDRVAFEVDGVDPESDEAWSVVVRGTAHTITDWHEGLDAVELGVTPWQEGPKAFFIRVVPASISGRRFTRVAQENWQLPDQVQPRPSPIE